MPVLTLHIGIPKTGSSAIQSALARNVDALRARGVLYPESPSVAAARAGRISSGNALAIGKLLEVPALANRSLDTAGVYPEIRRAHAEGLDLVYSSETLVGASDTALASFLAEVERIGYTPRIAIYLRSVAGLAVSSYHQQVKRNRYTGSFSGFLQGFRATPLRVVMRLQQTLDPALLRVRNYDGVRDDLVRDFFVHVLELDSIEGLELTNPRINRSMTPFEIALLREMNGVLDSDRLGIIASDALIYGDQEAGYRHRITREDLALLRREFMPLVRRINAAGVVPPLAIHSDDIEIGEPDERRLTEEEAVFARLIAGILQRLTSGPAAGDAPG